MQRCIALGRQYNQTGNKDDQYEAFRLLGQALHTLSVPQKNWLDHVTDRCREDFTAHSNFCELGKFGPSRYETGTNTSALINFGNNQVFPHVGQNVKVRAPNGRDVFPLVTGTFGGADFIHSLMGEATDHLSQASVSDLSKTMANARSIGEGQTNSANTLRQLFFDLPGGGGGDLSRDLDDVQNMRAGQPGGLDPSQMSPQELHAVLWKVLSFRDGVMKKIEVGHPPPPDKRTGG